MSARDYIEKDYYAALGVAKDASTAEIKKAHRKLAKQLHPDATKGDATKEARFKEVSEAYDVLSDNAKRKEYDEARALFASGAFRPGPGGFSGSPPGGFDINDLLGGLFGGRTTSRGPRRGGDVQTEVTLDFTESVRGVTVPLRLSSPHPCDACRGSGARAGTTPRTCPACGGQGVVARDQGPFSFSEPCRECRGRGQLIDDPCPQCRGTGTVTGERTLTVRIPAGVADGQRIRLAGKGSPGDRGGPAGDLFVVVNVAPHRVFGRKGDHLTLAVPITFSEATLGAEIVVPTLDGTVTLKVPAGTASGQTFRVKGRGVSRANGSSGDLRVTVEVVVPQKLTAKARQALESFAAASDADPRAHLLAEALRG